MWPGYRGRARETRGRRCRPLTPRARPDTPRGWASRWSIWVSTTPRTCSRARRLPAYSNEALMRWRGERRFPRRAGDPALAGRLGAHEGLVGDREQAVDVAGRGRRNREADGRRELAVRVAGG